MTLIGTEASHEVLLIEHHVYGMDPGKIKVEQVTYQSLTGADIGPYDSWLVACLAAHSTKSILVLVLILVSFYDIEQASVRLRKYVNGPIDLDLLN